MSGDEAGPRRAKRRLSIEERTLWTGVTLSIVPLRAAVAAEPAPKPPPAAPKPRPMATSRKPAAAPPVKAHPPAIPPLAPLDRRQKKRVARGTVAIDGRLDLHGLTQAEAHDALFGFLRQAQARGAHIVLVITGKGGDDPSSGRGVLKRQVPHWLGLPDFRACIVGYEAASIGHGGEGALYVRVRRGRG